MKNLDLENKELVFGKVSFMSAGLVGMTKEKFKKNYGGSLLAETDDIWKQIKPYTKEKNVSKPKRDK
tara:strand:+ start:2065 stop:2265 length:201 start_codon:yes stop_codon:yes gene_type:complete